MSTRNMGANWGKALGCLIIITCTYTAFAVAMLHVLQPELDPFARAISEYVHGPYGSLMTMVFFSQALGSLAMAAIAFSYGSGQARSRIGGALFLIAALGAALAGLFPADLASAHPATPAGMAHAAAGLVRFLALAVALPLISPVLVQNLHPGKTAKALTRLGYLFVAVFVLSVFILANFNLFGLGQRAFISILLGWMFIAASLLVRRARNLE